VPDRSDTYRVLAPKLTLKTLGRDCIPLLMDRLRGISGRTASLDGTDWMSVDSRLRWDLFDPTQLEQMPEDPDEFDIPRYYVEGTDDSARQPRYWILDSTRKDLEIAGPMPIDSARVLARELNEAIAAKEAVLVIELVAPKALGEGQPEARKIYQFTGAPGDRCLLNTGRWADSEVSN
jgi:hypothetical protein